MNFYIIDNKIGPGTIIKLVRSGEVIPHILEVIKSSKEPQLPNISYKCNDLFILSKQKFSIS